jgi:hypothetical protein
VKIARVGPARRRSPNRLGVGVAVVATVAPVASVRSDQWRTVTSVYGDSLECSESCDPVGGVASWCGKTQENPLANSYIVVVIKVFAKLRGRRALTGGMETFTADVVAAEYEWVRGRAPTVVALANDVRDELGAAFDTDVGRVSVADYEAVVDETFADGDRAVNVAALSRLLRGLDVAGDYPGFVVDELLGRELAATLAGGQPLRMLAEATFHYADVHADSPDGEAGVDDCEAALAAGVQTRVPGWDWTEGASPFAVDAAARRHAAREDGTGDES